MKNPFNGKTTMGDPNSNPVEKSLEPPCKTFEAKLSIVTSTSEGLPSRHNDPRILEFFYMNFLYKQISSTTQNFENQQ